MNVKYDKPEKIVPQLEGTIILDKYPHVARLISLYWSTSFFHEYIDSLVNHVPTKERPEREGFSFDALKEIDMLVDIHDLKYPDCKPKFDIWDSRIRR